MLEPSRDRLLYNTMLCPPEKDFILEYAVVCTYSLDLSALMAALLPLALDGEAEKKCLDNPIFMISVLEETLPKLQIFCDAGSIVMPKTHNNKFLSLLDTKIFPVRHRTAFHPKFWLLKFKRNGECRYRLAVLSKNLTFDRSWDVAMFFDGIPTRRISNGAPLADMLGFLRSSQKNQKARWRQLTALEKEIKYVEFFNKEIQEGEFSLIPFGVKSNAVAEDAILLNPDTAFYRLLVISPFLTPKTVSHLFGRGRDGAEKLLFTRKQALAEFSQEQISDIQCYCVKDQVISGECSEILGSPSEDPQDKDIHAKIYLFQQNKVSSPYFYMGSANLTSNGMKENNVELLLRVKFRDHHVYETIYKDLLPQDNSGIFEVCKELPEDKNTNDSELESLKQEFRRLHLADLNFFASVKKISNLYSVTLHCSKAFNSKYKIELAPFYGDMKWQRLSKTIKFASQSVENISNFYRIRLCSTTAKIERILTIDTVSQFNLQRERLNALKSSYIQSPEDFIEYLNYWLSKDSYAQALQKIKSEKNHAENRIALQYQNDLYEKLLQTAFANKNKLSGILDFTHFLRFGPEKTKKILDLLKIFRRAAGDNE